MVDSTQPWTRGQDSLIQGRATRGLRLPRIHGRSTEEVQARAGAILLNWRQRTEIMHDYRRGVSVTATAEAFGVNIQVIEEVHRMVFVSQRPIRTPSQAAPPGPQMADTAAQTNPRSDHTDETQSNPASSWTEPATQESEDPPWDPPSEMPPDSEWFGPVLRRDRYWYWYRYPWGWWRDPHAPREPPAVVVEEVSVEEVEGDEPESNKPSEEVPVTVPRPVSGQLAITEVAHPASDDGEEADATAAVDAAVAAAAAAAAAADSAAAAASATHSNAYEPSRGGRAAPNTPQPSPSRRRQPEEEPSDQYEADNVDSDSTAYEPMPSLLHRMMERIAGSRQDSRRQAALETIMVTEYARETARLDFFSSGRASAPTSTPNSFGRGYSSWRANRSSSRRRGRRSSRARSRRSSRRSSVSGANQFGSHWSDSRSNYDSTRQDETTDFDYDGDSFF